MRRIQFVFGVGLVMLLWLVTACGGTPAPSPTATPVPPIPTPQGTLTASFRLTSAAFGYGAPIPRRYTCDGEDISPPLSWSAPPEGTRSFVLICDDPDAPAGTWVHWVLYNIPAGARELAEGLPAEAELADGSLNGVNSWSRLGYGGPCPPGGTHRYFFKLYALDVPLALESGLAKPQVLEAMEGHILAETTLMGTYRRQP